jgi:hypothetical protein
VSAEYWLLADTGGPEPVEVFSTNITYNLGPMLRAAGFPDWGMAVSATTITFCETRYATGLIVDRLPGGRVEIETDDGKRLTGLRVPDHLSALAGGAVTE